MREDHKALQARQILALSCSYLASVGVTDFRDLPSVDDLTAQATEARIWAYEKLGSRARIEPFVPPADRTWRRVLGHLAVAAEAGLGERP
jgi:hypothetical protein